MFENDTIHTYNTKSQITIKCVIMQEETSI